MLGGVSDVRSYSRCVWRMCGWVGGGAWSESGQCWLLAKCLPAYQLSRAAELPEQAKKVAEKELKVASH